MKKILAICLTCCMLFTCVSTTAFAAENNDNSVVRNENVTDATGETGIMPCNVDIWSTNNLPHYVGTRGMQITVTPPKGSNLKVHFFMTQLYEPTLNLSINVIKNGVTRHIATWNTEGDHWADVVTNTDGGSYIIKMVGPAYINGAFYTEP